MDLINTSFLHNKEVVMVIRLVVAAILGGIVSGEVKELFGSYLYVFYPVALLSALGFIIILLQFPIT